MTTPQPKWGQSITLPEPDLGAQRTVAMVSLTERNIQEMNVSGGAAVPPVRDWTVYATAEGIDPTRLAAPNATVVIRYGSAASSFTRRTRIPSVGVAVHVVATWIDVEIVVGDSSLPAIGDLQVSAFASPGRPCEQVIADHAFNGLEPSPVIIPPFAVGWHGMEADGGGTAPLLGVWRYNGISRGIPGPVVAPTVEDAWTTSHAIPRDANQLALLPGALQNLHWWWKVIS